jgi:Ca-activated chloride channel family protein
VAVAAYGQKLRGDPWLDQGFDWPRSPPWPKARVARTPYGLRAEFVQLTRAAKDVKGS